VASILAPFVVYLSNIMNELPLIVLGTLGIFGGVLSLFLPETLDHELPQTLADGEEFGRGQGMWDFPCLAKKIDDDDEEGDHCGQFARSIPAMRSVRSVRSVRSIRSVQSIRSGHSVGASLRASTRGELGSSLLQRSVRSRASYYSINTKL
jgi:hypothetical protein